MSSDEDSRERELARLRQELAGLEAERATFAHTEPLGGSDDIGAIGEATGAEEIELPAEIRLIQERIAALEAEGAEQDRS